MVALPLAVGLAGRWQGNMHTTRLDSRSRAVVQHGNLQLALLIDQATFSSTEQSAAAS